MVTKYSSWARLIGISLVSGMCFISCKKNTVEIDFETEYFGLSKGNFAEYDVTHIFHDSLLQKHDTTHYQLKTLIGDDYIDNIGRTARKFHRFIRKNSNLPWQEIDIWTAIIIDNRAELVEENQRLIKLVFKPTFDKTWDINSFNNLGQKTALYSSIGEPKTINGMLFDETVTVEEDNYTTLIEKRLKYEVYAKNIGLVSKYWKDLKFNFGSTIPLKGEEEYYEIVAYGIQ
jgi:hypothetical protein